MPNTDACDTDASDADASDGSFTRRTKSHGANCSGTELSCCDQQQGSGGVGAGRSHIKRRISCCEQKQYPRHSQATTCSSHSRVGPPPRPTLRRLMNVRCRLVVIEMNVH